MHQLTMVGLKLEEVIIVWIMLSSTLEHIYQEGKRKEIYNNISHHNLVFLPCRIWDNLHLFRKVLVFKAKEEDQDKTKTMADDQEWLTFSIKEIIILMGLIQRETQLNNIFRCNTYNNNKVNTSNYHLMINLNTN